MIKNDGRIKKIARLLSAYSAGEFDKRLSLSTRLDDTDAVIGGLHMLGRELKNMTISRDYFNLIFNCASDMIVVVSSKGLIEDANRSASRMLGYTVEGMVNQPLDILVGRNSKNLVRRLIRKALKGEATRAEDLVFTTVNGRQIPVDLTVNVLIDRRAPQLSRLLFTATEATERIAAESQELRTILDSLEKERVILAAELHDSLSQQLAAVKFHLAAVAQVNKDALDRERLETVDKTLTEMISDLSDLLFGISPRSLLDFGMRDAIRELVYRVELTGKLRFKVLYSQEFPLLGHALEVDLYRVVQEFVTNTLKHAGASLVKMNFSFTNNCIQVKLTDNGMGLSEKKLPPKRQGMGLGNMRSRVKAHRGTFNLISKTGRGVCIEIMVPLDDTNHSHAKT
ncbi:MAG: PAS domain S-box protein [Puia sp.]|nr:PAS domain S-box protein [Puia sp.]